MSFDISKLTNAVNKYLNSISDVSAAAQRAAQEIEEKSRFSAELSDAIKQNIESRMRQPEEMPDIAAAVQNQVQQAVGTIDSTFEQVNGAFEEIRNAGRVSATTEAAATSGQASGSAQTAASTAQTAASGSGNFDAYSGLLSTEALQELSKSQYFSANLIQSSLFNGLDSENGSNGSTSSNTLTANLAQALSSASGTTAASQASTASAFDDISLSDLNTASLTAGGTGSANTQTDLAKALIRAYANSASSAATTSIFGDFSL